MRMLPPPDGAEEAQAEALEGFFGQRLQKKKTRQMKLTAETAHRSKTIYRTMTK